MTTFRAEPSNEGGNGQQSHGSATVWEATCDLLRRLGLTTIFGNPGSTEQLFLKQFPDDFTYMLALQEASAVAMADAYCQMVHHPVVVNLHTAAGTGNGMGNLIAAYENNTPLIVTAGQQTRQMLVHEPYLTNRDESVLPQPWVKWSYQPARPEDVPAAFMRAYAVAAQPPAGPVYLSIPLDDWDHAALGAATVRTVAQRCVPDPERLAMFAERIGSAANPALVFGPEVDRSGGWSAAVELAEKLGVAVYQAPLSERASFPEDHDLYQGPLPMSIGPLSQRLAPHDLVLVLGAPVFRYYLYVAGPYLTEGTELLHVTVNPATAAAAIVGDSAVGDPALALQALIDLVEPDANWSTPKPLAWSRALPAKPSSPLTPGEVYAAVSEVRPPGVVFVNESPSTMGQHAQWLPSTEPESFFASGSGGLGWGVPAAVGLAQAIRENGSNRPVVAIIGDGSFQYSVQAIWTAVQRGLPVIYLVLRNNAHAILKSFALLEDTPGVPGLDLPGLDIVSLAHGFGCRTAGADTADELQQAFCAALFHDGPSVIVVPTQATLPDLGHT
jgi:benzoylformate decarboxylase